MGVRDGDFAHVLHFSATDAVGAVRERVVIESVLAFLQKVRKRTDLDRMVGIVCVGDHQPAVDDLYLQNSAPVLSGVTLVALFALSAGVTFVTFFALGTGVTLVALLALSAGVTLFALFALSAGVTLFALSAGVTFLALLALGSGVTFLALLALGTGVALQREEPLLKGSLKACCYGKLICRFSCFRRLCLLICTSLQCSCREQKR